VKTIEQLAREIVAREGGFVNDPDDLGGATNFGVTLGTLRALGVDVNHDGRIDISDVKNLTREQAVDIYIRHYFQKPQIDKLPASIQPPVFDMQVNAGSNSVKILQRLLTSIGFACAVDGGIGPGTIRAASMANDAHRDLADLYGAARRDYYYGIADARPANRKYARRKDGGKGGWITRAEEFMSPAALLTDAQHRARVAKWG
jgi:lysozyme family protein